MVRIEIEGIGELVNPVIQGGEPVPVGLDVQAGRRRRSGVTEGARTRQNGGVPDTETELSDAERAERLSKLQGIIDLMRPAVQADGGDLVLVRADVDVRRRRGTAAGRLQLVRRQLGHPVGRGGEDPAGPAGVGDRGGRRSGRFPEHGRELLAGQRRVRPQLLTAGLPRLGVVS